MHTQHLIYNFCKTCNVVFRRQHSSKHELEGLKRNGARCQLFSHSLFACLIHQSHKWEFNRDWVLRHSACGEKMKMYRVNLNTKRTLKDRLRSLFARKFPELCISDIDDDASFTSCLSEEHKPAFAVPKQKKKNAPLLRQALLQTMSCEKNIPHGKMI